MKTSTSQLRKQLSKLTTAYYRQAWALLHLHESRERLRESTEEDMKYEHEVIKVSLKALVEEMNRQQQNIERIAKTLE